MIFVNRDKLKSVDTKKTNLYHRDDKEKSCQGADLQRNLPKVYVNPNFKSVVKSTKKRLLEPYDDQIRRKEPHPYEVTSNTLLKKLLGTTQSKLQEGKKSKGAIFAHTKLQQEKTTVINKNKCIIFLNPQFQGLTNNAQSLVVQKIETLEPSGLFQKEKLKLSHLKTSLNKDVCCSTLSEDDISKKVQVEPNLIGKSQDALKGSQKTICSSGRKKQTGKVYINPKFNYCQPDRSNLIVVPIQSSKDIPIIKPLFQNQNSNEMIEHSGISQNDPKPTTSKIGEVCVESKSIRRRKLSSCSFEPKNRSDPRKLLFVSKTKLVRNSVKYTMNSGKNLTTHSRLESANKNTASVKAHLNRLYVVSRHKITSKRKLSISTSPNTLKASPGKSALIKIRSKDGKSLKIVQGNQKSTLNLCSSGTQKRPLKIRDIPHEKDKKCMDLHKKSQFSKVNVPSNRSVLVTKNRYAYQKKNLSVRKSISSIISKNQNTDSDQLESLKDKVNFIKSKYRLIRKNCLNNVTKRSSRNITSDKIIQGSKRWHNQKQTPSKRTFKRHPKHLRIVNIRGVFYQCSRNFLTKKKDNFKNVLLKNKSTILHISGKKFKLENNGHTLKCLDKKPGRKRIDIGGMTFISSSSGKSLTRTNYHTARSIILQARQKRISQMTRKLRKNNEHCPFFHRFGKCSGKEQGTCTRQHDSKYVTVCKKFVQGVCSDTKCLLSHQISHHNLPTCQHFLAGQCGRDNCPYPHVKVGDDVPICIDFLRGYCVLGTQCAKRHLEICPVFEKGSCSRGKYCPYPHPKSKTAKTLKRHQVKRKLTSKPTAELVSNINGRYFEDVFTKKEEVIRLEDRTSKKKEETLPNDEERIHPKRPQLGRLPSFIPLSFDTSFSEYSQE